VGAIEKWASETSQTIAEMKADIATIKEGMMDMHEMKELMKEFRKGDNKSEEGENSVNDEVEKELRARNEERYDRVEEEPKSWTTRIELPTFEGIDPHEWVASIVVRIV